MWNRTSWMIGASTFSLALLIIFQVNWLQHSRKLIDELFNQKVTMALCSAIDDLSKKTSGEVSLQVACRSDNTPDACCGSGLLTTNVDEHDLEEALDGAMRRYNIDLAYQYEIVEPFNFLAPTSSYCSTMEPVTQDERSIRVSFSGREAYVIEKMGLMAGSSILILVFVGGLFILTLWRFLQQKRLNEVSVEFFNNMAHEFRTPLTNINLALGLLHKSSKPSRHPQFLEVIQGESNRLLEQVERMLHIAKLDRGEYQLEKGQLVLQDLIKEVLEDMEIQLEEYGGTVCFLAPSQPVTFYGDKLHLGNVLRNLLDNALKYCDETPAIQIELREQGSYIQLSLQDNGIGICDQQKDQLFQPFRRGKSGNEHRVKGFGLGLSYAKRVLDLHKGQIQVHAGTGGGSRFELRLPKKREAYES